MALQHLRSSTANKRPVPGNMSDGQLGINTNLASPGLFFKDTNGDLVKVGPVHVGTTAPNASPAAGGTAGNSVGEQWLDTTGGTYVFKVWDGSAWRSESGTFVDVNGDVMTGALGIIAGSAGSPGLYFSGDTNTGIYSPGADQVAISTGGSGRLFVNSAGLVGIGNSNPRGIIHVGADLHNGATDAAAINLKQTSTTAATGIYLERSAEAKGYYIYLGGDQDSLNFQRNNAGTKADVMTLTRTGNVGIGTASPGTTLDVAGTIRANTAVVTSLTNGILRSREFGGDSANNTIEYSIRPATGKSGYLTFTEDAVADRWSIGIQNGSDGLRFISGTPTSGTERCRIDGSGRLLIGTSTALSSPYWSNLANLQVTGSYGVGHFATFVNSTSGAGLVFQKSRNVSVGGNTIVSNNDLLMDISIEGNDGTGFKQAATIQCQVDGTPGANDMPGRLVFSTTPDSGSSPVERLRITNQGSVLINTATARGDVRLVVDANGTTAGAIFYQPLTTAYSAITFENPNGAVGSITTNGSATAYNTSSDYRLKENVTAVTDGITRLQQLKPSRFNFIADPDKTVDGFIAHEVQAIVPEAITGEKDAVDDEGNPQYQGIDQSKLVPLLTAALQEAIGEIESLKARVAALESA